MLEKIRSVTVAHSACAPTLVVSALVAMLCQCCQPIPAVCPQALFWCLNAAALSLHHSLPVAVVAVGAVGAAVEGLAVVADSASAQPLGAELAELAAGQATVTVAAGLVAARP
mmetsp:Transcript_73775/g.117396  ORF Transcript_73775/g.117396 Transcript_73775/m.117396 type:complete len:113 (-) Transcript_73775:98-436(-)